MFRYVEYTARLAAATPEHRNRVVDFWRALAIGVVVIGHWLAASIWVRPDDEITLLNSLEWVPYAGWITWVVQVMPIFFVAGGYANARGLDKAAAGKQLRRDWITARVRRLFTPVLPLLAVWIVLILTLRPFIPTAVIRDGSMAATVPLWFLAVYVILTAAAPYTHRLWGRYGPSSIAGLAAAAVAVDVAGRGFDVPGIAWTNFLFVWATVHQIGYWWADRDRAGGIGPRVGWLVAAGALMVIVVLTWTGVYPVAMLGIPGAEDTNMTPPTFAMALLGTMQAGIMWGTQPAVRRFTVRRRAWHGIVAFSGVIMTVYLWHLSAMSLVAAAGLFTFDGAVFRVEPGTTMWWASRPLWIAVLLLVTLALVAVFARFEWRVSDAPPPRRRRVVLAGVLLTAGSASAVALRGLATEEAVINWSIPIASLLGAALLGALPRRRPRTSAGHES